jgi:hypothetical protein
MLSLEEDAEAQALRDQGWSISAIARHLGRDRKTIRRYLTGEREPGKRKAGPDPFELFLAYCRTRLADDPHLWAAATLLDEITDLGYEGGYSTFTRALRRYQLRPHCEPCQVTRGRDVAIITHPPGEEPNGTGSNCPTRPSSGTGDGTLICWSVPWRIPAAGVVFSPTRRTSRTSSKPSTPSCASSAALPATGASTGLPPSATQPQAS